MTKGEGYYEVIIEKEDTYLTKITVPALYKDLNFCAFCAYRL